MTRSAPVIVTAALLVLAGCTGTLAGDAGLEAGASLDQMEYPDGYGETGVDNTTQAIATHKDELVADGGVVTVDRNGTGSEYDRTVRIDADAERVYSNSTRNGEAYGEEYYENDTKYSQRPDVESVYDEDETYREAVESTDRYELRTIRTFNWTTTDATVIHGTPVFRYEVTGVDYQEINVPPEDVERVNGTLLVDEDGRIHRFTYDVTIDRDDGEERYRMTYEVDSHGDVMVERPEWVAEYQES